MKITEHFVGKILLFTISKKKQIKIFLLFIFLFSWLRRKYEQSREEQRQLRLETRRLRRRQRRSIKRFQLQQDLQLAKSFGYS